MRKLFLIVAFALSLTVGCGGNRNVEEISKTEGISDTEMGTAAVDPLPTAEPEPTEELCGAILILDGSRVEPVISDGKIVKISEYGQNVYHRETEEISHPSVPTILTLMDAEDDNGVTTEYYSVYFAEESCYYCYNIRLRTDLFSKEEVLEIVNSVTFSDRAFY